MIRALLLLIPLAAGPTFAQDLFAARTLRVGSIVSETDLRPIDKVFHGTDELDRKIAEIVGMEVRRAIFAGQPITPVDLGPPTLVHRNSIVTIMYRRPGLTIRTEGRALDRGGNGERVKVMNLSSRESLVATVIRPGEVEVKQ